MDKIFNWVFFAANAKPTSMRRAIAERLAEKEPIVIVDHPISIARDRKAPPLKARCERLPGVEGCWQYRPVHLPERLPGLGRIGKLLNRQLLRKELSCLLPPNGKRIVCYDSPNQDCLVGKLGEDLSVYLAIDDRTLTVWGAPIPGELKAEKGLLGKIDRLICVSDTLAHTLSRRSPKDRTIPIHIIPNGYDERIFDSDKMYPEPFALAGVEKPRILVAGHVSERIDWEGVLAANKARPNWTWVFVGPGDKGMTEKIYSKLCGKGFYHPPIPVREVPAWIAHCDVCAVPYCLNSFTLASHPLKAIEYLAMGAPTVSTRIPSLIRYGDAILWVEQGKGRSYSLALDEASNAAGERRLESLRRKAVAGESWGVRVNQFRKIIIDQ